MNHEECRGAATDFCPLDTDQLCNYVSTHFSKSTRERDRERERERESVRACAEFSFKQNKTFNQFSINYWVVCVCVCVHAEFSFKQNMMFNQFSINYWVKQKLSQMYILHLYESYDFIFFKKELSLTGD